ncbi:low affinity immunoglobulin gamma Fc region receptor II-like [Ctenodactylus gundi]
MELGCLGGGPRNWQAGHLKQGYDRDHDSSGGSTHVTVVRWWYSASAERRTGLPKAVVKREPPWIQVLQEDSVTLTCHGARSPGNHSTQWFHNGSPVPTQAQSYRIVAKSNDSGEYACQTDQTSLSNAVHLDVISDWLVLQTPQLVFQEGETILLRCHSWKNNPLDKVVFYHNGVSQKYFRLDSNFSIPQANYSHSGNYSCSGHVGRQRHSSKSVTITIRGSSKF